MLALPWLRCLKDVQRGSIDAAMSASLDQQRAANYIPSVAYYSLTPSYFYLKAELDPQFHIKDINQLAEFGTVCGIKGFNYDNFGWRIESPLIEINALQHLPEMLLKHRCKFFLARQEILAGTLALLEHSKLPDSLISQPAPNAHKEAFYMLISKQSPQRELIAKEFNRTLSYRKQINSRPFISIIFNHLASLAIRAIIRFRANLRVIAAGFGTLMIDSTAAGFTV